MKPLFLIKLILISSFFTLTNSAYGKSKLQFRTTENIEIYDKSEIPFSDFGKIKEFQGILINKSDGIKNELSKSDIYIFPNEPKIAISENLCQNYRIKMFGKEADSGLTLGDSLKLFTTPNGKVCEFQLHDLGAKAKVPIRYIILGFIHGRMIGLVWQLSSIDEDAKSRLQKFWQNLH